MGQVGARPRIKLLAPRTVKIVQSRYKTHIRRSGSYNALFMRLYGACPRMRSGGRGVRLHGGDRCGACGAGASGFMRLRNITGKGRMVA
eukprot:scaffold22579_cov59-Phaeocystis_antarctica.AAC.1